MPLHEKIQQLLDAQPVIASSAVPSVEELRMRNAELTFPVEARPPIFSIEDKTIPGPETSLNIRVYTPEGEGPYPFVVYFHGGGFVLGNLETHDVICRQIANYSGYKVVSVEYRLAPENPFPAAIEDGYAAVHWVSLHGHLLGGDPSRITVGGDSAGGNIAAAVCLMARDRKEMAISTQLLLYPVIDYYKADEPSNYASYFEFDQYGLSRLRMSEFWRHYMGSSSDPSHPYASLLKAKNLQHLPEALIVTAEYDVLRDEGEAYAERLKKEGVRVHHERIQGVNHGFLNRFHDLEQSIQTFKCIAEFLTHSSEAAQETTDKVTRF